MAIEEDPPAGVPEWVVTYGDMMSLLLTFFIMLVSMSEMKTDDGKFRALMDAMDQVFGPEIGMYSLPGKSAPKSGMMDKLGSLGASMDGGMLKGNKKARGPGGANNPVKKIRDGHVITIGGPVAFERFSAEISEAARKDLDLIVEAIREKPNRVEVRGHDSPEPQPAGGAFRDATDLSFARAHAVARYLIEKGILAERIRISAAGDSEPRAMTRGVDSQSVNRRVDLFLIDAYITAPTEGAAAGGS